MINTWKCPRCRGKLTFGEDHAGSFLNCWNCGYYSDFGKLIDIQRRHAPREDTLTRMRGLKSNT